MSEYNRLNMNYAKVGVTEGWMNIRCVDAETNLAIEYVTEINCEEGWAIVLTQSLGSTVFTGSQIIRGRFRLMSSAAAKKLEIKNPRS